MIKVQRITIYLGMPYQKLQNYLRTHRKRVGLSQREVAFLLGCKSGTKVSRYECFARQPALQTIFAYELIFGRSARELFAGLFQEVERETLCRVQFLSFMLARAKPHRSTIRKLAILEAITAKSSGGSTHNT